VLPERELTMMPAASIASNYRGTLPADGANGETDAVDAKSQAKDHG
jgi:hypothetical protein